MAYTLALPIPIGVTGLTLLASFVNTSGTLHATLRNLACTEIGVTGVYRFSSAAVDDSYRGQIVFHTTSVSVDEMTGATVYSAASVNPEELEFTDAKTSTITAPSAAAVADAVWDEALSGHATAGTAGAALTAAGAAGDPWSISLPGAYAAGTAGYQFANINAVVSQFVSGSVTVSSPVNATGTAIDIYRGDDFRLSEGRQFGFSSIPYVLTGGTVLLKIGTALSVSGTVTSATACYFELSAAQTSLLSDDAYAFEVQATLSNGHEVTVASGTARISGQI